MNRKKWFGIMAAICLLVCCFAHTALAESAIGISTPAGLLAIADNPAGNYYLEKDIDLSDVEWNTIQEFSGTLDGKGHAVKNLSISYSGACPYEAGMFGWITGTVKNLIVENAQVKLEEITNTCTISILGNGFNGFDENNVPGCNIQYCEISGKVEASAAQGGYIIYNGLCGASFSSSDVDVDIASSMVCVDALYYCDSSHNSGDINVVQASGNGYMCDVAAIQECVDCENTGDLSVSADVVAYVYGIRYSVNCSNAGSIISKGKAGDRVCGIYDNSKGCVNSGTVQSVRNVYGVYGNCKDCENSGTLISGTVYGVYNNCDGCENSGLLIADTIYGIYQSYNCINSGNFQAAGNNVTIYPVFDDRGNTAYCNNQNTGFFVNSDITVDSVQIVNYLNSFSQDKGGFSDISKVNAKSISIQHMPGVYYSVDGVYQGTDHFFDKDINITINSGIPEQISIYYDTSEHGRTINTGDITMNINGSGKSGVSIYAGSYNTGDITIRGTGMSGVSVIGGTLYNGGNINIDTDASGSIGATGVYCSYSSSTADDWAAEECILNEGNITVKGSGVCSSVSVYGADGPNAYNTGSIRVETPAALSVEARGAQGQAKNAYNEGEVFVTGIESRAVGAYAPYDGEGSAVNCANVSAYADTGFAHAWGATGWWGQAFMAENTYSDGTATAESQKGYAEAYSNYGNAIAKGYNAVPYAEGQTCMAANTQYGLTVNTNQAGYWATTHTYDSNCTCNLNFTFKVDIKEDGFIPYGDGDHEGDRICVAAKPINEGSGQAPDIQKPEIEIPEGEKNDFMATMEPVIIVKDMLMEVVSEFTYACGSFIPSEAENSPDFHLYYTIEKNGDDNVCSFTITLPDGFSFEEYEMVTVKELDCYFNNGKNDAEGMVAVYPIYSESMPGILEFEMSGEAKCSASVSVVRAENEGVVLCRNTRGVAKVEESIPIRFSTSTDYQDMFVKTAPSKFSDELNELGCALAFSTYIDNFAAQSFRNLGFSYIEYNTGLDNHDVGCAIARKKIINDGRIENILAVAVRGTLGTEWVGNFVVLDEKAPGEHADFRGAANSTKERINTYCNRYGLTPENTQMFICGHSRAAAATNLIAHDLNTAGAWRNHLRAYTYATPNSTKNPVAWDNIFNYAFLHDFVAYVPNAYYKHGTTYVVGLGDQEEIEGGAVAKMFKEYSSGAEYKYPNQPYLIGIILKTGEQEYKFSSKESVSKTIGGAIANGPVSNNDMAQGHGAEGYLAWVRVNGIADALDFELALDHMERLGNHEMLLMADTFKFGKWADTSNTANARAYEFLCAMEYGRSHQGARLIGVSCPVDVQLLDEKNKVIAQFNSHELISADQDRILAFAEDETDYLILPRDENLTVRITATDDGDMDLNFVQINGSKADWHMDESDVAGRDFYTRVPLVKGETYTMKLAAPGADMEWALYDPDGNLYKSDPFPCSVYLPAALKEIRAEAYMNAAALTGTIVCPKSMESIGENAFAGAGIEGIYIPESVNKIHKNAFGEDRPMIYCMENSEAHAYAVEYKFEFTLMEEPVDW